MTRTIARQAQHGGNKCPGPSSKTETCNSQPCAGTHYKIIVYSKLFLWFDTFKNMWNVSFEQTLVHCQWSAWKVAGGSSGKCSKACGGGSRTLTRTIKRQAQHGGNKCPGPSSKLENCNTQPCSGEDSHQIMLICLLVKRLVQPKISKLWQITIKHYTLCGMKCFAIWHTNVSLTNFSALSLGCMERCWRECWKVRQGLWWRYQDIDQDNHTTGQHGGNKCPGPSTKTEHCNTQPCAGKESGTIRLICQMIKGIVSQNHQAKHHYLIRW